MDKNSRIEILSGIIALAILAAFVLGAIVGARNAQTDYFYPTSGIVVNLDEKNDIVTVEDANGFLWEFSEVEDWAIGDRAAMLMDSHGTEKIFDDKILKVRYVGR